MKIREFEVGTIPPQTTNVVWLDTSTLELKFYIDGQWQKLKDNDTPYELPVAKSNVLGGVKIGDGLSITSKGVLSVSGIIEVSDITALTNKQLDALEVGDKVIKITGTEKHLYLVTYKATTGGGICLSYNAAGYGETVSYDRTESGWVYNSTDIKTYGE